MSISQIRQAKIALGVLWVLAAASFFAAPGSGIGTFGRIIFWLMLGAHAIECIIFWGALRGTGKPVGGQIIQTLLFGVVHYQAIKDDARRP